MDKAVGTCSDICGVHWATCFPKQMAERDIFQSDYINDVWIQSQLIC